MPAPDPQGLDIEEAEGGEFKITAEVWWYGNQKARIARMLAVSRNIRLNGWKCAWCCDPVPLYRRADAKFCCEGCRKRAALDRRQAAQRN